MKRRKSHLLAWVIVLALVSFSTSRIHAQENQVLGEVQFDGPTNVEKTSGVWVDGEYVGYVKELKGSKKILLLPGEHVISVRQNGYQDFVQTVVLQPGQTQVVRVTMDKAATGPMPADDELATIRIWIDHERRPLSINNRRQRRFVLPDHNQDKISGQRQRMNSRREECLIGRRLPGYRRGPWQQGFVPTHARRFTGSENQAGEAGSACHTAKIAGTAGNC